MNVIAILAAVIELSGLSGGALRARAYFDANNVKVGDPLTLSIDFLGNAAFEKLHPPRLSRFVDPADWKIDDVSAKTDTYHDARRLLYRARPMRKGLLWFPALKFAYRGSDGEERVVTANAVPVHAKGGVQVVVEGMDEASPGFPSPPQLITSVPDVCRGADEVFAWKKACASPSAAAFSAFDFPEARMNEASCAVKEGNWSRALEIYRALEWRSGQTADIEKGIISALALKYDNPSVELPVWRQVLRPLLKYPWFGRLAVAGSVFLAAVLIMFLLRRGIRAVACFAIVFAGGELYAQGLFERFFGAMQRRENVAVTAIVESDVASPRVGENFSFTLSLEYPRSCSVEQLRISPVGGHGLSFPGNVGNLPDAASSNPSNVVKRMTIPARFDVPFKGRISFNVGGMIAGRTSRGGGGSSFSFSFSNSFNVRTDSVAITVRPLPTANQPADFGGIIGDKVRIEERCDIVDVETNDVVRISYVVSVDGFVPEDFYPSGVDFEWARQATGRERRNQVIEYRRFFVADGKEKTPEFSVSYYDVGSKTYKRAEVGGTRLKYRPSSD